MEGERTDGVRWDAAGLAPAVVQDARTGEVLTLAWMSAESLARTLETGETWFYSRSRGALWHKGETSGHTQRVVGLAADCDRDALLVQVVPAGPACHTGARSCFFEALPGAPAPAPARGRLGDVLEALEETVRARSRDMPEGSYTAYLLRSGVDKVLKKVGEEAAEVIIAAKGDDDDALAGEVADLLYHLAVLAVARDLPWERVARRLEERRGGAGGAARGGQGQGGEGGEGGDGGPERPGRRRG